jgi:NADH-quinone oxidoreductase subunit L
MFLALGSGRGELAVFGVAAAIFHLFTHAFFKALLFLASGSVMHAMGNVIDMRRFGGLRAILPVTHWTFFCGAAALAGLPPLSGFWSKDEVVDTTLLASHGPRYGAIYFVLFVLAMLTALLTAFYTFRAYFRTFWGEVRVPPEAGAHGHRHTDHANHHDAHSHAGADPVHAESPEAHITGIAHESPPVMAIPLMVLAVGAVVVGMALGPTHWFGHFSA